MTKHDRRVQRHEAAHKFWDAYNRTHSDDAVWVTPRSFYDIAAGGALKPYHLMSVEEVYREVFTPRITIEGDASEASVQGTVDRGIAYLSKDEGVSEG